MHLVTKNLHLQLLYKTSRVENAKTVYCFQQNIQNAVSSVIQFNKKPVQNNSFMIQMIY